MASGFRRMRINTQERAVSVDINRLQTFAGQDSAELHRYLLDAYPTSVDEDLGTYHEPNTLETPLRAEIIGGLLVKPQGGSLNIAVDPGVMFAIAPDSSPDESNYKFLRDDGLAIGTLLMTANASGSTRIDLVECSINPTDLIVADSRDIFNPATALFSATSVTKELRGRLQYRVTLGTPGSGMPARSPGWLPLMVASVPTGTTSNDTITFWDVRPLTADRSSGPQPRPHAVPKLRQSQINAITLTAVAGLIDAELNGRRVGGRLRTGGVIADAQSIDVTAAANREAGFALVASQPWFIYLCTPFGLPRWARYTDGPAGRLPRAPRGIPIVSMVAPDTNGAPSATISLPTNGGLGGSVATTEAICVSAGWADATAAMKGFYGDSQTGFMLAGYITGLTNPIVTAGGAFAGSTTSFSFASTKFPPQAREILVEFQCLLGTTAASAYAINPEIRIYAPDGVTQLTAMYPNQGSTLYTAGAFTDTLRCLVWIPLPTPYPAATRSALRVDLHWGDTSGDTTYSASSSRILGWRL
jgi:hypothetical protein